MSARVRKALEAVTRVRGVRGAVLADRVDGLVVAASAMADVRSEAVAALGASLLGRCAGLLADVALGDAKHIQLQGLDGTLLAIPVAEELLLVAVGDANLNVGLVRTELQRAAKEVT